MEKKIKISLVAPAYKRSLQAEIKKIFLSVIIPAYNEEKIIGENLKKIVGFLSRQKYSWEIVVVDDGSKDRTSEIVKSLKNPRIKLIKLSKNSGKGAALREGVKNAAGDSVIFTDADLSVPIDFLSLFLEKLKDGSDVVIGSRRTKGSKIIRHQPLLRETMGRFYTLLSNLVTGTNISDFTCGFKGFTARAAHTIFSKSLVDRWSYDVEILYLANKLGFRILEIPVSWINREETRVSLGSAVTTSFTDLIRIRFNDLLGKYDK